MRELFTDIETYSPVPINHGTHAYAEQAEVMLWPYAIDDGKVQCWDITSGARMPSDLADALADERVLTVWHNGGMFDRVVLKHALQIDLPIERVHDTMVRAMAHSLPGSLDKLGDILNLDMRKDKRGKELIQLFCKPRPKNQKLRRATSATHPEAWQEFIEYAIADIPPMRELYRKLPRWNYQGAELALWHLDQQINMRGVAVDVGLAHAAIAAARREQAVLAERTQELTDGAVASATKRDKLLQHIINTYQIELPDLKTSTVEKMLEQATDLPQEVRELLLIRVQASKTSTSKYNRLIQATSSDGRLRGLLQFCGASRTGRWAGRVFQPQNLPRPSMKQKEIDLGIEAMKYDCEDLLFTNVMELASSAIRGCIIAPENKKLCVADLSNIEGRMLAWLAGERWKLKAFYDFDAGTGADLYALAYAKSFNVTPEAVMDNKKNGDGSWRQIGKVMELALGYQGGVGAFLTFAAAYGIDLEAMADQAIGQIPAATVREARDFMEWLYGQDKKTNPAHWLKQGASQAGAEAQAEIHRSAARHGLTEQAFIVCDSFKRLWREAHLEIASWWRELEQQAQLAIANPGQVFHCRKVRLTRTGNWLRIILPSGRSLCYPSPKIEDGKITYMGVNQYNRKWCRITTYGGKLAENCIAEGTEVLTSDGWLPIESVTSAQRVWDGVEWVAHTGCIYKGKQTIITSYGVDMTPDHRVLTERGWTYASSCEGFDRADCRLPDGYEIPRIGRAPVTMGSEMYLRKDGANARQRAAETSQPRYPHVLWLHAIAQYCGIPHQAWDDESPSVCCMEVHAGALQSPIARRVQKLWHAADNSVRTLAEFIQKLLAGHGADLPRGPNIGQDKQRCGVQPGKLSLDFPQGASQQPASHQVPGYARWTNECGAGSQALRHQVQHPAVPAGERLAAAGCADRAAGCEKQAHVYDLVNCGPRSRFVVRGRDGLPLIVHNCTQAAARDVLAANMPRIEQQNYSIVLSVHDELLTETPDTDDYSSDHLAALMSQVPTWATGLPLAAAGFEATRYKKD